MGGITSMESAAAEMPPEMPPEIDCGWPSRLAPYVDQGEQLRGSAEARRNCGPARST